MNIRIEEVLVKEKLMLIYNSADSFYNILGGSRKYHSLNHSERVVGTVAKLTGSLSPELILAAKWHDAIYIPGSKVNEEASADALLYTYKIYETFIPNSSEMFQRAADLIRKTTVSHHLVEETRFDGDLALLLDADLVSLADDYDAFIDTQEQILIENKKPKTDLKDSAEFLCQFQSAREFIYHTERGRELFEKKAQKNIDRIISEYM